MINRDCSIIPLVIIGVGAAYIGTQAAGLWQAFANRRLTVAGSQ
jgi:hypothetical protein